MSLNRAGPKEIVRATLSTCSFFEVWEAFAPSVNSRLGKAMSPAFLSTNVFFCMIVVDGHIKHSK